MKAAASAPNVIHIDFRSKRRSPRALGTASDYYNLGASLDENPATYLAAKEAYEKALELCPTHAVAMTNLGNVHYRLENERAAELCYRIAIELDPEQPEAVYNLGYLLLERGEPSRAEHLFRKAIELDPLFAVAHFNLAISLEQMGKFDLARLSWKTYIAIAPKQDTNWIRIAKQHLART